MKGRKFWAAAALELTSLLASGGCMAFGALCFTESNSSWFSAVCGVVFLSAGSVAAARVYWRLGSLSDKEAEAIDEKTAK